MIWFFTPKQLFLQTATESFWPALDQRTSGPADQHLGAGDFSGRSQLFFQRRDFTANRRGDTRPVAGRSSDQPAHAAVFLHLPGSSSERPATGQNQRRAHPFRAFRGQNPPHPFAGTHPPLFIRLI